MFCPGKLKFCLVARFDEWPWILIWNTELNQTDHPHFKAFQCLTKLNWVNYK